MRLVEHRTTLVSGTGETERSYIADAHLPVNPTSCGFDERERYAADVPTWQRGTSQLAHHPAYAPKTMPAADGELNLDCPCDVECPRCHAPIGKHCTTLDGGGSSGGGFYTNWHVTRVKASPRCRAIATGDVSRCDFDDHDWEKTGDGHTARCSRCEVTAPYEPATL